MASDDGFVSAEAGPPIPARLVPAPECMALDGLFGEFRTGGVPMCVVVHGAAGSGKTCLLYEWTRKLAAAEPEVELLCFSAAPSRCRPRGFVPFPPLEATMSHAKLSLPPSCRLGDGEEEFRLDPAALFDAGGGPLEALLVRLPSSRELPVWLESVASTLLTDDGEQRPRVVVVDDVDRLEATGRLLLGYMAERNRRGRGAPVMFVVSARGEHGWKKARRMLGECRRMEIAPRSREFVFRQLDALFPENSFSPEFKEFVFVSSHGDPSLAAEMALCARATGRIFEEGGVWRNADWHGWDAGDREKMTIERIGVLREEEFDLLEFLCDCGVPVNGRYLMEEGISGYLGCSPRRLLKHLSSLESYGLIAVDPGGRIFVPDERLVESVRKEVEPRVREGDMREFFSRESPVVFDEMEEVELLETLSHLLTAGGGTLENAAAILVRKAMHSMLARGDLPSASSLSRRVSEALWDPRWRGALLLVQLKSAWVEGNWLDALELVSVALEQPVLIASDEGRLMLEALERYFSSMAGAGGEPAAALEKMLEHGDEGLAAAFAGWLAGRVHRRDLRYSQALRVLKRSLVILGGQEGGCADLLLDYVLLDTLWLHVERGDRAKALPIVKLLLEGGRASGYAVMLARVYEVWAVGFSSEGADPAAMLVEVRERIRKDSLLPVSAHLRYVEGCAALEMEALQMAREAFEEAAWLARLCRERDLEEEVCLRLVRVAVEEGDDDGARLWLERRLSLQRSMGAGRRLVKTLLETGSTNYRLSKLYEAERDFSAVLPILGDLDSCSDAEVLRDAALALLGLGRVLVRQRKPDRARENLERAAVLASRAEDEELASEVATELRLLSI